MKIIDINSIPRVPEGRNWNKIAPEHLHGMKRLQAQLCIGSALFIALAIIIIWIWILYQDKKDIEAQRDMFQATYHFEASDFEKALEGDNTHKGFLAIVQQYSYTKTANLACFYIGVAYMHQKAYDKAITALEKFKSKDLVLPARAWCLIGDAYSEQKHYDQAAKYYMKAANYQGNSMYTPIYLKRAALAFEANNQHKDAYQCYLTIVEQYPTCYWKEIAMKEMNRLSLLM